MIVHALLRPSRAYLPSLVAPARYLRPLSFSLPRYQPQPNMSDSEASDYSLHDDSGSDDYGAAPKAAKKAATKPAPKKAPAKPAAAKKATTKKPLATKKNAPNDSISEDESQAHSSPLKPSNAMDVDDVENAPGPSRPVKAPKDASEMYQKLSQLEHILKRPDSYIGSVEAVTQPMWVFDPESKMMVNRQTTFVPGFFKIFDEILVNAADNKINDPTMDTIKVNIDRENNKISVYNNGKGIPVELHKKEKIMIPELIFGQLLTSSNYDDEQKKLTGGRNGYGAKLANIYSTEFIVETADKVNGKKYRQVFQNNMGKTNPPKIVDNKKEEEFTRITFSPELSRFHMTSIDDDTNALLMKRVYDIAGTVKDIKVFLNDERLKIKGFKQYVEMYLNASSKAQEDATGGAAISKPSLIYEAVGKRWEVAFALSDGQGMQQVSFANSIATTKGGTHVNLISDQLTNKLLEQIKKKNKNTTVQKAQIRQNMWIFVNAMIENAAFDSQTKENMTLKTAAFGSKCELSEDFVKKVSKSGIVENVLNYAKFRQDQQLKKTDGAKRTRISGIVKLEDANWAGGRNGKRCTLILTEGDSAKALAVSGLSVVGRDEYGVFPLRGKLLNVREASHDQIIKNVEIQHIKQILGLKHNTDYTTTDSLRYGHLMIMTDQDHDGSHIKGLIINYLDHFYPSLLKIPDFLVEFITPIVKVSKGKQEISFFTMPQYEEWKEQNDDGRGWKSKYYKGLGTSKSEDAKKYFSALDKHRLAFNPVEPEDRALIDMAFNKKKADDRKEWLRQFKPGTYLDHDVDSVQISDFVNKELILFSMADNIRSIPSVADGLKPGQRKVMFACFKRNMKLGDDVKVAQLGGYIGEQTQYHHGEASLYATITGLAQNFVGSNNINLLEPNGQFGTRIAGGKDAASPRYIFTGVPKITRTIFHPDDDGLFSYLIEDGQKIEPEFYLPTVPLVLINGADGIGTGWSTAIPNFNPSDIVENLRRMMRGEEPERMNPWFRGFRGSIERIDPDRYKVSGVWEKVDDRTLEITELPIRKWTQDYKEMLEEMTTGTDKVPATVKDYEEHHTDTTVHFRVQLSEKEMKAAEEEGFEKRFKLSTTLSTGNMVCFDLNGKIKKYASAEDILVDFYHKRLEYYGLRKQFLADELNVHFERLSNQARFVQMIVNKEYSVSNKKKAVIVTELREMKFRPFPKSKKAKDAGENEAALDEDDEGSASDYDYLLGMALWSLTRERVEKLLAERNHKEEELMALLKLSPQDIWNVDLERFVTEWENVLQDDVSAAKQAKPKTQAAIKAAKKKAKRAAGDDSDSEEDFKPTKAAAKPKALGKPKAFSTQAASPVKRDSENVSEASDVDIKPPMKKAAMSNGVTNPKAAAPKPKVETKMDLDNSDDDAFAARPTKPKVALKQSKLDFSDDEKPLKAKPKPAPKKVAKKADSDFDESDDDFAQPVGRPAAARPGRGAAKKTAYIEMSDEDEDDDFEP